MAKSISTEDRLENVGIEKKLLYLHLITISGYFLVMNDPNLCSYTVDMLHKTEAEFVSKESPEHTFLLSDHDPIQVYLDNFISNNRCGIGHVEIIIRENQLSDYLTVVAEFAIDKSIPFMVSLLLFEDLKTAEGGLHYSISVSDGFNKPSYRRVKWTPVKSPQFPPMRVNNTRRDDDIAESIRKNVVLQTYITYSCSLKRTAAAFGVCRITIKKRIQELGFTPTPETRPEDVQRWIDEQEQKILSDVAECDWSRMKHGLLPMVPQENSKELENLKICYAYYLNDCDTRMAAYSLSMAVPVFESALASCLRKRGNYSRCAMAGAIMACSSDLDKTAAVLETTPEELKGSLNSVYEYICKIGNK